MEIVCGQLDIYRTKAQIVQKHKKTLNMLTEAAERIEVKERTVEVSDKQKKQP